MSDPLSMELSDDQVGDLSLLEAATPVKLSNTKRRGGESLGAWGSRLKSRDSEIAKNAKDKKKKSRSGADADFEAKHPRGRDGTWTFKSGSTGSEVKGLQRRIGGTAVDGKFGDKTTAAVRRFQKRHGLQVDGIVGAQTIAAMRGKKSKVAPGAASDDDRKWLKDHATKKH